MKSIKQTFLYKIWLSIFLISLLGIGNIRGQEISPSQDSLSVDLPIVLSEIPSEFTHLSNYLVEISDVIQAEEKIVNNDSIISSFSVALEASKQEIETALPTMTYQRLESLVRAWYNYKNKFNIIQETLKDRIIEIEIVKNELEEEWKGFIQSPKV